MEGKSYHFVLVHGACHGAWCWYKTIDLLEKVGHKATAIDLAASGQHPADVRSVTSFEQYNQPLINLLASLEASEKVILVGHSTGGLSLADASGRFPNKIAAAVYVSALMFLNGVTIAEDIQLLLKKSDFTYEMVFGIDSEIVRPAGLTLTRDVVRKFFCNLCLSQDVVLSELLRRPYPACCLNAEIKHPVDVVESVRRVFVKLAKDKAIPISAQDFMISRHPPDQVLSLDTDHSPFFSAPQQLHDLLLQTAQTFCDS
ncbi:hypothetical protein O6H91_23G040400 [Diphasiastrum complanatum]|uniref:Uncharacterized protein n=1 Tax=Diphasiastrum complanatum TaxID=34168 RepID=A0ACC2AB62_DIPCM|nr:hypothetical protein O6H91_23G040400 [Diphasiastrum complanatum]